MVTGDLSRTYWVHCVTSTDELPHRRRALAGPGPDPITIAPVKDPGLSAPKNQANHTMVASVTRALPPIERGGVGKPLGGVRFRLLLRWPAG